MNYVQWECCSAVAVTQDQKFILENVLPDTKFTATVLVNVCEPSCANKDTSYNIHLIPCSYKARLDLEPAYLQVLVHYLLTNCS